MRVVMLITVSLLALLTQRLRKLFPVIAARLGARHIAIDSSPGCRFTEQE